MTQSETETIVVRQFSYDLCKRRDVTLSYYSPQVEGTNNATDLAIDISNEECGPSSRSNPVELARYDIAFEFRAQGDQVRIGNGQAFCEPFGWLVCLKLDIRESSSLCLVL